MNSKAHTTFVGRPHAGLMMMGKLIKPSDPDVRTKRFLVFAGEDYSSFGGWDDALGSADTIDDAIEAVAGVSCDWWQVIDLHSGHEVARKVNP